MTPKEKAQELVNKFRDYSDGTSEDGRFSPNVEKKNGIKCSLIAVGEIISAIGFSDNDEYWGQVKKELEIYE